MMGLAYGARAFGHGPHLGMPFLGPALGSLLVLTIVAIGAVLLVAAARKRPATGAVGPTSGGAIDQAVQIVRERLARGEISADEYMRIVDALTGRPATTATP